ncbi:hypothetical protein OE88DRAFT_1694150 [Heliocybe sulcata]|uniref:Protein OS-9 homolog n=1 Tax=Heliocybe sulcata TaxID=5364 RepID=A0A5C3NDA5_9AGAM|nr:hypothetical protein OE88DRAFT_1694150 [Heliocybe sulcata]
MHTPTLVTVLLAVPVVLARSPHYIPEDPYAFPKYRVTFLNGLPVSNQTAQAWLQDGLRGGELEFLEQPWQFNPLRKGISSGDDEQQALTSHEPVANYSLQLMKIGPQDSFLCFVPPPPAASPPTEDTQAEVTPVHSWSLLQPLSGTCLYHKQGWFTYSYCHNSHVRQFREMPHAHPHPGGYRPEEDPDSEAYTLGRAPPIPEPGAELTVSEEAALAANLELARDAGASYLVQRWGDGTLCDKTGRHREIEVQFHCSMTMTDTILFVKETRTCHYVMVIHTPRLCGEPGFKSRREQREESFIRCREIVPTIDGADKSLPETDYPLSFSQRAPKKPILPPPATKGPAGVTTGALKQALSGEVLNRAFEALLGTEQAPRGEVVVERLGDTDVVIEFIDAEALLGENDEGLEAISHEHLAEALRAAGFDIKGEKKARAQQSPRSEEKSDEAEADTDHDADPSSHSHDEL